MAYFLLTIPTNITYLSLYVSTYDAMYIPTFHNSFYSTAPMS